MKLIVVSNSTNFEGEINMLHEMFENGLELFHLRKPDFTETEIIDYLNEIKVEYRNKVVLHSHLYLRQEFGINKIHFNSKNIGLKIGSPSEELSASCHSYEEVNNGEKLGMQYVFLSPIFDSISKLCYESDYEKEELQSFLNKKRNVQVIALSGVDASRIEDCSTLGFDGIGVLGAVWESENPLSAFINIKEKCLSLEKTS